MKSRIVLGILLLFCILSLSSCSKQYYACSLNSFGGEPIQKSYYLNVSDSLLKDDFTYRSHIQAVKNSLGRIGYIEMPKESAALIVDFEFNVGDVEYAGSSSYTQSTTVSTQIANASINKTSNANVNASTQPQGNSIKTKVSGTGTTKTNYKGSAYTVSNNYGTTYTGAKYKIPIKCTLTAFDSNNEAKVWSVDVYDYMVHGPDDDLKIRICVPWMLAAAEPYIGKDAVVPRIEINEKDGPEKYGLTWNIVLYNGFETFVGRIYGNSAL